MNKKSTLYLLIFIIAAAVLGIWFLSNQQTESGLEINLQEKKSQDQQAKTQEITVGYGFSIKPDAQTAVQEAVSTALKNFSGQNPEYAIIMTTVDYDEEKISQELNKLLPQTKIQGITSTLSVYTTKGFHASKNGSLAVMLISSPKITFGVAGVDIDNYESAKAAGKDVILKALTDAGKKPEDKPKIVYLTGSFGNEEGLLVGMQEILGKEIPIVGGSAFDNDATGQWKEFYNNQVFANGVVITAFFTDLRVGWAYEAGYDKTEYKGIITKAKGRTLYEIDNRPALEVYDEWTNGIVKEIRGDSKEDTLINIEQTALNPIAKIMGGKHGEVHYLTMHPYLWNFKDQSIGLGVEVKPGEEITLVHGTWEINLNHCRTTPNKALSSQNIKPGEGYFAIYSYCVGKYLSIPEEEREKIPVIANQTLGNIPMIGGNTGGEQGLLEGVGNEHGGLVNDIIIFAPAK